MIKVDLAKKYNKIYLEKRTAYTPKYTNQNIMDGNPTDKYTPIFSKK